MVSPDEARRELARRELARRQQQSPQLRQGLSDLSALTQEAGRGERELAATADQYERGAGTSLFADMTGSGMQNAVPFADEMYSLISALPNAAISAAQGEGFSPTAEYNKSQALSAELERRRGERHPTGTLVAKVAGGIGASAPIAAGGLSFLNGAKPTLASMAGRGAAEGAAYGAAYGLGEGEGLKERLSNALWQGLFGSVAGGTVGALGRIGAGKVDKAGLPTAEELKSAAQSAYQRADDAGVIYSKGAVGRVAKALEKDFADFGYHPELQGGAKVALNEINRLAADNATLKGLDTARKIANNAFQPGNKANNALANKVTKAIDDLVTNPLPGDIITGNGPEAAQALQEARGLYRQAAKLDTVNRLLERAGRRASASGSGGNIENATRQELNKILNSEKLRRGFTKEELDAIRRAVVGSKGQDILRLTGKLSPEGNGLSLLLHLLGGSATGGATVPLAAVGMLAKRGSDALAANSARIAEALIANGGPLPAPSVSALRQRVIEALTRGSAASGYLGNAAKQILGTAESPS